MMLSAFARNSAPKFFSAALVCFFLRSPYSWARSGEGKTALRSSPAQTTSKAQPLGQTKTEKLANPLNDLLDEAQRDIDEKQFEAAIPPLEKVLADQPDFAYGHFQLAYVYTALKKPKEAQAEYQRAVRLDPKMSAAYVNLGMLLLENHEDAGAVVPLRKAVELLPAESRPRYRLAVPLDGSGDRAGAEGSQRDCQEIARAAFRGKQLDGLAQRRNRPGVFVIFEKQHAQVDVGGGHFGIEPNGALVFGLRLLGLFERRVNVGKLKMAVGKVRLIGEDLLERRDGRLKLFFVDIALCLVEQIVERIGKFFRFRLAQRLRLRGRLGWRREKRFPVKRGFALAASSQGVRRSQKETDKRGREKLGC